MHVRVFFVFFPPKGLLLDVEVAGLHFRLRFFLALGAESASVDRVCVVLTSPVISGGVLGPALVSSERRPFFPLFRQIYGGFIHLYASCHSTRFFLFLSFLRIKCGLVRG